MFSCEVLEVLVASPSDLREERRLIPELIHAWNAEHALEMGLMFSPVLWETHSTPEMGERPQAILNRQLADRCDLLIGAFWTRLGTPTGEAPSGTVEEIERFTADGKRVLLYFSSRPVALASVDEEQYANLKAFKAAVREKGLFEEYEDIPELREKLPRHLTNVARELRNTVVTRSESLPLISPVPDERGVARSQLSTDLRRLGAEWAAERDSDPMNLDEGKFLLSRLESALLDYQVSLGDKIGDDESAGMAELLKELRTLARHSLFIDGGRSFREFWERGDKLLHASEEL